MSSSKAVATRNRTMKDMATLMNAMEPRLAAVATKHLTPERIIKVALTAATKNPKLLQCTNESLLQACMMASQIGLEPGGPLQHAVLIPRWNKKANGGQGGYEAQYQTMYQGWRELVLRTGHYRDMEARAVFERDQFDYEYGLTPKLRHVPYVGTEHPGELTFVYSVAWLNDPAHQPSFDVMTRAEVEKVRARSQSPNDGPWVTDYPEMAKKTVVIRHRKILRLTEEQATQMQVALESESADGVEVWKGIDPSAWEDAEPAEVVEESKTEKIKKVAKKRQQKVEEPKLDLPSEDPLRGKRDQLVNLRKKAREYDLLDLESEAAIEDTLHGDDEGTMDVWLKHLNQGLIQAQQSKDDEEEDEEPEEG